jgi:WD40 repeat protein
MDSAGRTSIEPSSGSAAYDGFISYSHAADDLLAPRLQAGLQRFAKPWWKRRAVRIFRDESSLAANPHLWSSITEALDDSSWFVLLLSQDAAQSEWVGKEIEHWVANKPSDRILPVVTDGDFTWENGDVAGSSVPPALHGVFSEEPRWVDLRFARGETHLDLQNPDFSAAVADIASAIRGIPKDELASEEVRQHRRTVRTAWAAGIAVTVLAIAAVVAGVFAIGQRNDARDNAQLARAQELAAASTSVLESDPELASLLAVLSIQKSPGDVPVESVRALRKADRSNLLQMRIPHEGFSTIEINPDGTSVLAFNDFTITAFDLATGTEEWSVPIDDHIDWLISTTLSPDGSIAALTGRDTESGQGKLLVLSIPDREIVEVFTEECWNPGWHQSGYRDTNTWQEVARLQIPEFMEVATFDQDDGHLLVIDMSESGRRVEVRSYPGLEVITELDAARTDSATFDRRGDRVAIQARDNAYGIHDVISGQFLGWVEGQGAFTFGAHPIFSPEGETLLVHSEAGNLLVDSATGKLITQIGSNEPTVDAEFTPDGGRLVTSGENKLEVWILGPASNAAPLRIEDSRAVWVNPDRIIDGPTPALHLYEGTFPIDMITQLVLLDPRTGATIDAIPTNSAAQLPDGRFVIVGLSVLPEIRFGDGQREAEVGGLSIWDPSDHSLTPITECSLLLSQIDWFTTDPTPLCDSGDPAFATHGFGGAWFGVSPDGSRIAADSPVVEGDRCSEGVPGQGTRLIRVWDVATTAALIDLQVDACETLSGLGDTWLMTDSAVYDLADGSPIAEHDATAPAYQLTESGSHVIGISGEDSQDVLVLDTQDWSEVAGWEGHNARIRGVAISPDGRRLATTGTDEVVRIWDLSAALAGTLEEGAPPPLLDEIPVGIASDALWIDDEALGVALRDGTWTTVALDPDALADQVLDRLQRSFSVTECENYRIDPCPTLDELLGG